MRVIEEPFISRDSILMALRPGQIAGESQLRTLRNKHKAASVGLEVNVRLQSGRLGGRLFLYSSLNADAARAFRLAQPEIARKFARFAQKLERTPAAKLILGAVRQLADRMPGNPLSKEAPGDLRRYVQLRRQWQVGDNDKLARQWLVQSSAWLSHSGLDRNELFGAIQELSNAAEKVRAELLVDQLSETNTFYGYVRLMDRATVAVEAASGEIVIVQRSELERQGLASIGQPLALLQETMPGGGFYSLPMPAAMLEPPTFATADPAFDPAFADGRRLACEVFDKRDGEWLQRAFAKDPSVVPIGPIPVK